MKIRTKLHTIWFRSEGSKAIACTIRIKHLVSAPKGVLGTEAVLCLSSNDQTHADLHDIQDTFERQALNESPSGMTYAKARDGGIKAHSDVFKESGCNPECIKKQLDNYHKGECGVSGIHAYDPRPYKDT